MSYFTCMISVPGFATDWLSLWCLVPCINHLPPYVSLPFGNLVLKRLVSKFNIDFFSLFLLLFISKCMFPTHRHLICFMCLIFMSQIVFFSFQPSITMLPFLHRRSLDSVWYISMIWHFMTRLLIEIDMALHQYGCIYAWWKQDIVCRYSGL